MNIDHHDRRPSDKPKWSSLLCSCEDDIPTCCITCWVPCVTFGRIAHIVDDGRSSCVVLGCTYGALMVISWHWVLSCLYRNKLRGKFDLPEDPCNDCCLHFCCEPCALCQEYAELKNRGFDPSIGWIGPPNAPPSPHKPMSK